MKQLLYTLIVVFGFSAFAQQESILFHIQNNPFVYNPGSAGFKGDMWALRGHYRQDWARFSGASFSQSTTVNGRVADRLAVGFGLVTNGAGYFKNVGGRLGVAYNLPINSTGNLGIGIGGKFSQLAANKEDIRIKDPNDIAVIDLADVFTSDIDFGLHFTSLNAFAGLAATQLAQFSGNDVKELSPTINLYGGYKFAIQDSFKIEPSLSVRYAGSMAQVDVNVRAYFLGDQLFIGGGTRLLDGMYFNGHFGLKLIDVLHLAYSYDFGGGSSIQPFTRGNHELMLGWDFNWKKPIPVPETDEDVQDLNEIQDKPQENLNNSNN